MLVDLVNRIDHFIEVHGGQKPQAMFKADLLELVQKAIEHGEAKDQGKISGILVKVAKSFFPGSK
jgi:hypothetical protein